MRISSIEPVKNELDVRSLPKKSGAVLFLSGNIPMLTVFWSTCPSTYKKMPPCESTVSVRKCHLLSFTVVLPVSSAVSALQIQTLAKPFFTPKAHPGNEPLTEPFEITPLYSDEFV